MPDGTFGLISFRGISGLLNNNTIDGGDNNQAFFAEERGRTRISYSISQAAIREFQVNTSSYSASTDVQPAAWSTRSRRAAVRTTFMAPSTTSATTSGALATRSRLVGQLINGVFLPVGYKPKDATPVRRHDRWANRQR